MTDQKPDAAAEHAVAAAGRSQYSVAYFAARHDIKREQAFVILEQAGASRERADEAVWKFKHH
jgi:hypothetical protein